MNGDVGDGRPDAGRVVAEDAVGAFAEYLWNVKGSSSGTAECYSRHVRSFLARVTDPDGVVDLRGVSALQVRSYVTVLGGRYAAESLKLIATSIRSFLGFAWMSGWTTSDLRGAVGPVVVHRSGRLPRALPLEDVQRLLGSADRSTTMGVRDYALMLLLFRLGLRAGEVASLRLDDIDWGEATITARVKGGGRRTFPIPQDVGQAVVAYLRQRPGDVTRREVFLQVRSSQGCMNSSAVTQVVARNAARAGLGTVRAHRLRHSAARAVLAGGGTLAEVGELLGHRTAEVTMVYASFDLSSLRALVRPWPVEVDDA